MRPSEPASTAPWPERTLTLFDMAADMDAGRSCREEGAATEEEDVLVDEVVPAVGVRNGDVRLRRCERWTLWGAEDEELLLVTIESCTGALMEGRNDELDFSSCDEQLICGFATSVVVAICSVQKN